MFWLISALSFSLALSQNTNDVDAKAVGELALCAVSAPNATCIENEVLLSSTASLHYCLI